MYRITELGREFGLSRSTLLYYDRIGLLSPTARSRADYRLYTEQERQRLESICTLRRMGLSLEDIRTLLATAPGDPAAILQRRMASLGREIRELQAKQRLLADMLKVQARGWAPVTVDKATWVGILRAAGMSEEGMDAWHQAYERQAPEAHQAFLESLGIEPGEVERIRERSRS
jgi:DNA-binding transcriptional MerR regulator